MKVYAFVKIRHHPQEPDGPGVHYGDIVSFHRVESKRSEEELKFFLPVLVDINIPCGDKYDREMRGKCGKCKWNDPKVCDVQKYCRGEWSEGTLFEPPTLTKKRRYRLDLKSILPSDKLSLAEKEEKTEKDRLAILDYVSKNEISPSLIVDKVK